MRRLLKLALWLGVLGGVAWLCREPLWEFWLASEYSGGRVQYEKILAEFDHARTPEQSQSLSRGVMPPRTGTVLVVNANLAGGSLITTLHPDHFRLPSSLQPISLAEADTVVFCRTEKTFGEPGYPVIVAKPPFVLRLWAFDRRTKRFLGGFVAGSWESEPPGPGQPDYPDLVPLIRRMPQERVPGGSPRV